LEGVTAGVTGSSLWGLELEDVNVGAGEDEDERVADGLEDGLEDGTDVGDEAGDDEDDEGRTGGWGW
jgi:hypothetical protein